MRRLPILAALLAFAAAGAARAEQPKFTLNAAEAPDDQPWSDPAAISYTKDKGAKGALTLDAAGRWDWRAGSQTSDTRFFRAVVHRDTTTGAQVETYAAEFGLHFEPPPIGGEASGKGALFLHNDLSLGYAYKTNFDDEADGCDATPKPAKCARSHEGSVRLKWTVQPFVSDWSHAPSFGADGRPRPGSPPVAFSFGPVLGLFADGAINAKVDGAGVKPKGVVSGAVASLGLALSPRLLEYRLVFRASVQQRQAFQRDSSRKDSFAASATLGSVSLDYELGQRAFDKGPGWSPSIGVSYVKGDDPLSGTVDKDETVIGFKLKYNGP